MNSFYWRILHSANKITKIHRQAIIIQSIIFILNKCVLTFEISIYFINTHIIKAFASFFLPIIWHLLHCFKFQNSPGTLHIDFELFESVKSFYFPKINRNDSDRFVNLDFVSNIKHTLTGIFMKNAKLICCQTVNQIISNATFCLNNFRRPFDAEVHVLSKHLVHIFSFETFQIRNQKGWKLSDYLYVVSIHVINFDWFF